MALGSHELSREAADVRFCQQCGAQRTLASGFCAECGSRFAAAAGITPASKPWQAWVSGICSAVALIFLPPVFGAIAIYLALQVRKWNEGLGTTLIAAAVVCTVLGFIFGVLMFAATS
jgi:hypothetical protein